MLLLFALWNGEVRSQRQEHDGGTVFEDFSSLLPLCETECGDAGIAD